MVQSRNEYSSLQAEFFVAAECEKFSSDIHFLTQFSCARDTGRLCSVRLELEWWRARGSKDFISNLREFVMKSFQFSELIEKINFPQEPSTPRSISFNFRIKIANRRNIVALEVSAELHPQHALEIDKLSAERCKFNSLLLNCQIGEREPPRNDFAC